MIMERDLLENSLKLREEKKLLDMNLEELEDRYLLALARSMDLNLLLEPIKRNNRFYMKYTAQLGRMNKHSPLVKMNLPNIAVRLFRQKDENYVKIFEVLALSAQREFIGGLASVLERDVTPEECRDFSVEEFLDILHKYEELDGSSINLDYLWVQLKLNGIDFDRETRLQIGREWDPEFVLEDDEDEETDDAEDTCTLLCELFVFMFFYCFSNIS